MYKNRLMFFICLVVENILTIFWYHSKWLKVTDSIFLFFLARLAFVYV